jgi:hypothetical protein
MDSVLFSDDTYRNVRAPTCSVNRVPVQRGARTELRAGVVGLGKQALDDHIPALMVSDVAKLVAGACHFSRVSYG